MTLPRAPPAVVFDMDGLLFDTEALYRDAIMSAAADLGRDLPLPVFLGLIGRPWEANRAALLDHFGRGFDVDAFRAAWMERFEGLVAAKLRLKAGAAELLDALDGMRLPRAIATSARRGTVDRHLAALGLGGRFHAVAAQGDYERGKPHPDPFLEAAELLGVEPRSCLALEDSLNGVRSASAAGMVTVMVPDLLEATDEARGLCARGAADLHEVLRLLREAGVPGDAPRGR